MVAGCDPRYDISSYFGKSRDTRRQQFPEWSGSQIPRNVYSSPERRQLYCINPLCIGWKCGTREFLTVTNESNWQVYDAVYYAINGSILVEEPGGLMQEFELLARQWREETAHLSSVAMMAEHSAYKQIINMGMAAVPMILQELRREPDHWFWALSVITQENPVNAGDAGDISKMTKAWLQLGRTRGWI